MPDDGYEQSKEASEDMRIGEIRALAGPNVYTHKPVLIMDLHLEELTEKESHEIPRFIDRLLQALPGLHQHHCAAGRPGGFIGRLHGGTYFGHIVEHVALELTEAAEIDAFFGKTRSADGPGHYKVIVEYTSEAGTRYLLRVAVELVDALVKGTSFPLSDRLEEAKRIVARTQLGPSTGAIVNAAERRGIPWTRIGDDGSLVRLGYGKHLRYVQAAMSANTSAIAVDIASDKELTKRLLEQASIPVPWGRIVQTEEEAIAALADFQGPLVVKPLDGRQGKGVSLNPTTPDEVRRAFQSAREFSRRVLIEECLRGRNYRVLVVNGKAIAACERLPAHVVGDGRHTIAELIEIVNQDPRRGEGHEKPLTKIAIDSTLCDNLEKQNLSQSHVPAQAEVVWLRQGANLSTGGTAKDVTDLLHPETARICERAARIIGLNICGIDWMLTDIAEPIKEGGGIIEVNASPGLRMHLAPSQGEGRDVGKAIVDMLYPPGSSGRIPIVSITGTNGKTTVTRMIGHVFAEMGKTVGMATTDGIYIGGQRVFKGDTTGPRSARAVLSDPAVEVAVLETARGGIVRSGLGYDWSDVAVMTNIQSDHIGQDGIQDIDDLVYIKSVVAERVREGGTLILNADDAHLAHLADQHRIRKIAKEIVYFSLRADGLPLERHLAHGGIACFLKEGWVVEAIGPTESRVVCASDIPITINGTAEFQVANVLAAVAACRAYGVTREEVASALTRFQDEHNPGRSNLYQVRGGYVLVDYGHNPGALEAVSRMISRWNGRKVTGIIGVPGDRADRVIEQVGRVAARSFHRLIIKEDGDLRGRKRGEVPDLLCRSIRAAAPERECSIIPDETEALTWAINGMEDGELIVVFYEQFEPLIDLLKRYHAVALPMIAGCAPSLSLA